MEEIKAEQLSLSISVSELEALIRRIVEEVIKEREAAPTTHQATTAELCHALQISRQAVNSWYKDPDKKGLLERHRHKKGGQWLYDLERKMGLIFATTLCYTNAHKRLKPATTASFNSTMSG